MHVKCQKAVLKVNWSCHGLCELTDNKCIF